MIVDTSALVAVTYLEKEREPVRRALASEEGIIPAPVLVEYTLVTSVARNEPRPEAAAVLNEMLSASIRIEPFTAEDAAHSAEAHRLYGRGNGRGGKLNMLDVMVYCMARRLGRPILCTGRDFASTDAQIHPASRPW